MDCSMWAFPVLHYLPGFAQTMSMESVMPSNRLIFCRPLLLLPSIFSSIKVFYSQLALHRREEDKGPRCEILFLSQKKEQEQVETNWKLWASQRWPQTTSTVRLALLGAVKHPPQFVPKAAEKGFTLQTLWWPIAQEIRWPHLAKSRVREPGPQRGWDLGDAGTGEEGWWQHLASLYLGLSSCSAPSWLCGFACITQIPALRRRDGKAFSAA